MTFGLTFCFEDLMRLFRQSGNFSRCILSVYHVFRCRLIDRSHGVYKKFAQFAFVVGHYSCQGFLDPSLHR